MRLVAALASVVGIALTARAAHALKPCAPDPCRRDDHFDETACRAAARWVATGRIEVTERRPFEGDVQLEFGSFELTVDAWEKGEGPAKVSFVTTWCWNDHRLLAGDGKRFRVYGVDDVAPDADVIRIHAAVPLEALPDPDEPAPAPKPKLVEPRIDDVGARRGPCGCEAPGARGDGGWLVLVGALLVARGRRRGAAPSTPLDASTSHGR